MGARADRRLTGRPDPQPLAPPRERGFVTVELLLATALSLVLLATLANLVTFQYARGVVRAALDEGARAGSRFGGGAAACEAAAGRVLNDLLGGSLGSGVAVSCHEGSETLRVTATGVLRGWAPLVPDWPVDATATRRRELPP